MRTLPMHVAFQTTFKTTTEDTADFKYRLRTILESGDHIDYDETERLDSFNIFGYDKNDTACTVFEINMYKGCDSTNIIVEFKRTMGCVVNFHDIVYDITHDPLIHHLIVDVGFQKPSIDGRAIDTLLKDNGYDLICKYEEVILEIRTGSYEYLSESLALVHMLLDQKHPPTRVAVRILHALEHVGSLASFDEDVVRGTCSVIRRLSAKPEVRSVVNHLFLNTIRELATYRNDIYTRRTAHLAASIMDIVCR
jgi:hypothetical protein